MIDNFHLRKIAIYSFFKKYVISRQFLSVYPGILGFLIFWVQKWMGGEMIKEQILKVCNITFKLSV